MWTFLQPMIGPIVKGVLDLIPNVNDRAKAKEDLEKQLMSAVESASAQQNKINAIEAKHKSVFVAGWRPAVGWVCVLGLVWAYFVHPMVSWYASFAYPGVAMPELNTEGLYTLLMGLLGMGGLRTFEKMKGVSRETK